MSVNPLIGPPPAEVPLPSAPLVRVMAQVRFPLVTALERRDFIAPFQEAIRDEYPVLRQETAHNFRLNVSARGGPSGPPDLAASHGQASFWRFHDPERVWWVTLTADFLTFETTRYTSRDDFLARFERLVGALADHVRPGALDRVGVRYVDRLTGAPLDRLGELLSPALLGPLGTPVADHALVSVQESLFELPEESGHLRARWGRLQPRATIDPTAVEPLDEPSWVLDIDTFVAGERPFRQDEVAHTARRLAERAYAFFRWSVTDAFLDHFGGAK